MDSSKQRGLISAQDRVAFAWLWGTYLRGYLPTIFGIFLLITTHGLALVGFLAIINSNFTRLFDPGNGSFEFSQAAQTAHGQGRTLDGDGDGRYDIEIGILLEEGGEVVSRRLSIAVFDANQVQQSDLTVLSDGVVAFTPAQVAELLQIPGGRVTLRATPDRVHINFVRTGAGPVLLNLMLILLGATFFRVTSSYASGRLAARVTAYASLDIRRDLIQRLLSLDLSYFDTIKSGQVILTLNDLVADVQAFFSSQLINAAKAAVTILGILGYLCWVHPGLFTFIALVFPISFWGLRALTERLRTYMQRGLTAQASYLTNLENTVGGIRTIKLTNQSDSAEQGLVDDATGIAKIQLSLSRYTTLMVPLVDLLAAFAVIGIIALGGLAVLNGWAGLTAGTLVTFVIGLALIFSPANRLSSFNANIVTTFVALQALYAMDQQRPRIKDAENATDRFDAQGDIVFEGVKFAYATTPDRLLFAGLDLTFQGGKTSALVGQTGSGKTTLLSLIARLYEPLEGRITLGGSDIATLQSFALRNAFSVVTQDVFIFDASVEDNIRFVKPDATKDQIGDAITKAQLTSVIEEKGTTPVGPRGAQLSGGQKQRIAIARAFLTDAPIVLLDEATSALDQQTESKISAALRALCTGKTTLIIAHRLATITHADQIFVLEAGQVAEQGTHDQLLAQQGLYAALYRAQQGKPVAQTPAVAA